MSKIVCIGDVHGRRVWRNIINKENDADKIIFLGDYVSTHWPIAITEDQEIEELYGILDYKENNKDKVVLLRGNHDIEGLGYYWAQCSPAVRDHVARYMQTEDVTNWFLSSTQWIYQIPDTNIICSHAGISKTWLSSVARYLGKNPDNFNMFEVINEINNIEPNELFGFTPSDMWDCYGDSWTQPCTWIRPNSLDEDKLPNIIQVVGHTRDHKGHIYNYNKEIWCIDALSDFKDDVSRYLVIENGEFKIIKI